MTNSSKANGTQRADRADASKARAGLTRRQILGGAAATVAAATIVGLLCLCILVPAMIVVWLLPLYYGILAYGELAPDGERVAPVGSSSRRVRALWDRAGDAELASILVGLPATHPAEPIDGCVVSDRYPGAYREGGAWHELAPETLLISEGRQRLVDNDLVKPVAAGETR